MQKQNSSSFLSGSLIDRTIAFSLVNMRGSVSLMAVYKAVGIPPLSRLLQKEGEEEFFERNEW